MRSLCGVLVLGLFVGASYVASAQAPMTAADYPAKMKAAVQANVEMQKALKAGAAADAVAPAKAASAAFADIEGFWAAQKKDDAVKLAAQAKTGFADAAAAAAKGDADGGADGCRKRRADLQAVPLGVPRGRRADRLQNQGHLVRANTGISPARRWRDGSLHSASSRLDHFSRLLEDARHHRRRQLASVGVLPARVVTPDQPVWSARTITHLHDRAVRELRTRADAYAAAPQQLQPRHRTRSCRARRPHARAAAP